MSSSIYVDRVLFPVTTLGPGERVVVWTSGCSKRCDGCSNPELWVKSSGQRMPVEALARQLFDLGASRGVGRMTLTGGDPLEQFNAILELLEMVRPQFFDVLVYTGFDFDQLASEVGQERLNRFSSLADVIVDGPYVDALNEGGDCLRGSSNQRVIYLNDALESEYAACLSRGRVVQNFVFGDRVISVGIHGKDGGVRRERG